MKDLTATRKVIIKKLSFESTSKVKEEVLMEDVEMPVLIFDKFFFGENKLDDIVQRWFNELLEDQLLEMFSVETIVPGRRKLPPSTHINVVSVNNLGKMIGGLDVTYSIYLGYEYPFSEEPDKSIEAPELQYRKSPI